jgi:hypothetical protein
MKGEAMATGAIIPEKPGGSERAGRIATWIATIFACVYIVWTGTSLYYSTSVFIKMFSSMGLELHTPALMLIAGYRWLYPILFGGTAALVVAKQFFVREKVISLTITFATTVTVAILSGEIVRALYRPLFDLVEKLK